MHALGIPTTRSLAIVHVPNLLVERETEETAAIVSRMAPSFIRIGSFQAHNPAQVRSSIHFEQVCSPPSGTSFPWNERK